MENNSTTENCYHCSLPVPGSLNLRATIDGQDRPMCCLGCQSVAQTIVDSGLESFYQNRTAPAPTVTAVLPDFLQQLSVYDEPELQKSFVTNVGGVRELWSLYVGK